FSRDWSSDVCSSDLDRLDQCPNTLPGAAVEPDGCVRAAQRVELPGVNFEFGSARLTESAERILERAYLALRDQPEIVVEIAGHRSEERRVGKEGRTR